MGHTKKVFIKVTLYIPAESQVNIPACTPTKPAPAMVTMLATSAVPSWCNDIPTDGRQYIAACGGSGSGNSGNSNSGAAPSWCQDIPAASRANVPSCVNAPGASLSGSQRLAGVRGLLVAASVIFTSRLFGGLQ